MTDERDEYGIRKDVDGDYIGVEKKRADVSDDAEAAERARERFEYGASGVDGVDTGSAQGRSEPPEREGTDMSHRFGRHAGSLAGSDYDQEIDEDAPRDHDGRAETRTGFNPREAPTGERDKWRRLNTLNDDGRHPDRRTQNRSSDRKRWVDTFCSCLDMTAFQKERTQHVVEEINMGHMAHYSSQQVILAIISLVANEDDRWIRDESSFRGLMDDIDVTLREVKNIRRLVRTKSDSI